MKQTNPSARKPIKTSFIGALLTMIGSAFIANARPYQPGRSKGGRRRAKPNVAVPYTPGVPGAKLAKKVAKGTVGLGHGAPFGQR